MEELVAGIAASDLEIRTALNEVFAVQIKGNFIDIGLT
jgi:hypothetical protein